MEYSGRVNIWLAGGFGLLYAAYLLAGDHWPPWMGRVVFDDLRADGRRPGAGDRAGRPGGGAGGVPVRAVGLDRRRTAAGGWNCCCSRTWTATTTGTRRWPRPGGAAGVIWSSR